MPFDEKYFNSYVASLLNLETIEEFIASLPSSSQDGYHEFITNLISYVNNEIKSSEELKSEGSVGEDLESELLKLNQIRSILVEKLSIFEDDKTLSPGKKNIIFLTTSADKACALSDIKDIPGEYAESVIDLVDRLENFGGETKFDDSSCKKLSFDNRFKDVFELKNFKVRLYFKMIDFDSVVVLMIAYKTQNNPKTIKETLESRVRMPVVFGSRTLKLDKIKKDLLDENLKSKMIKEHSLIKEELKEQLKRKIR